jgi:hypothetical protein
MKVSSGSALLEGDIEMGPTSSSDIGYVEVSQTDPRDLNAGRGIEITAEEALRESSLSDEEDDEELNDLIQSPNDSLSPFNRILKYFTDLTIPHGQYVYGVRIVMASFLAAILIDNHDVFSKMFSVLAYVLFWSSVPSYFGYALGFSFQMSEPEFVGGHRRFSVGFICKKLAFPPYRMVSFASWLNGLVLCVTTFIFSLPPDCYKNLKNNYHFPDYIVIHILIIIQVLFYMQKL